MKRILPMLLLLGALIGLFGQSFAYAAAPVAPQKEKSMMAAGAMSPDCAQMMQAMEKQQPAPDKKPCKGLTLDCIAAMGCLPPAFLGGTAPTVAGAESTPLEPFSITSRLPSGAAPPPEPHPPSTFA